MSLFSTYNFFRAVLIAGCFFLCACENDEAEVKSLFTKKLGVEEARIITLTFTTGGKTKAILTSPLMLRVQDTVTYIEFPKTLEVNFYDELGNIESTMTAMYGRYKESENIVFLKDSVRVINTKKETLNTQELYWNRGRTGWEFYTDKPVRIRTLTHIIDGVGMEASQDFKQRHIMKTTGMIKIPSAQFPM
ncbi:MAG: LPS export ABC transporter periplasmic protein LptC [Chitinophagaceae bacterium]|nr:MAG: LPS export ABC transporter periplasmic protein LptC [Chitinophagaceae bacterium]